MNKIIEFILPYAKKHKISITIFFVLNFFTCGIAVIIPYITGNYIDNLVQMKTAKYVYIFSAIVFAINALNLILRFILDLMTTRLNSNIAFGISSDIYEHMRHVKIREFENKDSVYLSNRITNDSSNITHFCINRLISIFTNAMILGSSLLILLKIYMPIAGFLILLLPIYIILYIFFRKPLLDTNRIYKEKQDEYLATVSEQFRNIYYIKINCLYEEAAKKLQLKYKCVFDFLYKYYKLNYIFSNLGTSIIIIANVSLTFAGGLAVIKGHITIGMYSIINIYFNMIVNVISFFLNFATSLQEANASYCRIKDLLNIPLEHNGKVIINEINRIQINNLSFAYNGIRKFYNNSSLSFEKGNIYWLTGENGAGKTTFINLLLGLHMNEYTGTILFNEIDIKNIDFYNVRRNLISVSTQEPILMNNTILENILLGINNTKKETVIYWCKTLNVFDTIKKMPEGINTKLTENSFNISGGEKQKFTHIRSFIKNSNILIIDEPTSALDRKSIESLRKVLLREKREKIIIVISHDLSLTDIADYRVYFGNNKISCQNAQMELNFNKN